MSKIIFGFNGYIGVEPPVYAMEKKIVGGIAAPTHRVAMVPLKVVFGTREIPKGCTVWVNAQFVQQKWVHDVFEIDNKRVCLLQVSNIQLISAGADDGS